jgi:hypothetical protein
MGVGGGGGGGGVGRPPRPRWWVWRLLPRPPPPPPPAPSRGTDQRERRSRRDACPEQRKSFLRTEVRYIEKNSVGDGDPDPHVFGPPESGSISKGYKSGSGSFPFLIKMLSGLK